MASLGLGLFQAPAFKPWLSGEAPPPDTSNLLKYQAPDTTGWTVVNVPATGGGTNGRYQLNGAAGTDYLLVLPSDQKRVGNITVSGGRNIAIIGGEIETANNTGSFPDQDKRCLYFINQTGQIYLEGLWLHRNATDQDFDCIFISDTGSPTIQGITVQNCLLEGIKGTSAGWHGDGMQWLATGLYGGTTRLDKVTVRSDYQGFYNVDDGVGSFASFNRANFVCTGDSGVMLWFGDNDDAAWARKDVELLEGVYLDTTLGGTFDSEVRPNSAAVLTAERPVINSGVMTWPNSNHITGSLIQGTPPGGDYVTSAIAGFGYESPGYQGV